MRNTVNTMVYATEAISRYRAVVADSSVEMGVKLPASEGASHFMGVTGHDYCTAAGEISLTVGGEVEVYANGAITSGQYVKIASSAGDVENAENATPAATWVVGMAKSNAANGALVVVDLSKQGYMTI